MISRKIKMVVVICPNPLGTLWASNLKEHKYTTKTCSISPAQVLFELDFTKGYLQNLRTRSFLSDISAKYRYQTLATALIYSDRVSLLIFSGIKYTAT
jgi:hypothetical protein